MKTAMAFASLLLAAPLLADPGEALLAKTYAKLSASFSAGGAFGGEQDCLLLASPGLEITAESCKDLYSISRLADTIPRPGPLYLPGTGTSSAAYQTILAQAEASAFVDQTLREEARLARRALFDKDRPGRPTKAYAAYLECQAAFASAQDGLNLALTEQRTSGKVVPPGLEAGVQTALKAWEERGGKLRIEKALAVLEAYYAQNARSMLLQCRDDLEVGGIRDDHPEPWFPVTALPPPETWFEDAGWRPFTLTQSERSLAQALPPTGAAQDLRAVPREFAATATLSMETKRVTLERPWMNLGMFRSRRWRLNPSGGFSRVSSGQFDAKDPGIMPLLVTGVLLSRKLVIKGQWAAGEGKGSKAFGPFALDGAGARVETGVLTLTQEAPQILGFFCKVIPRSPDPDDKAFRH
jgi:hypothetical protein